MEVVGKDTRSTSGDGLMEVGAPVVMEVGAPVVMEVVGMEHNGSNEGLKSFVLNLVWMEIKILRGIYVYTSDQLTLHLRNLQENMNREELQVTTVNKYSSEQRRSSRKHEFSCLFPCFSPPEKEYSSDQRTSGSCAAVCTWWLVVDDCSRSGGRRRDIELVVSEEEEDEM
ncbi:hypothetical protein Tco_0721506 [Tanacetum coccineum]